MKNRFLIPIIAILLTLGALVTFVVQKRNASTETSEAKVGDIVEAVYGLGTVTPNQTFQLKIGVTASIRELYVREGDPVRSGTPLLKLDEGGVFRAPFSGTVTSLPFKPGETVYPQLPIVIVMNLADRYVVVSLEQEGALRVKPGQTARMSVETLRGQTFVGTVRTLFPGDNQFLVHIDFPDLPPQIIPGMTGDVAIEVARKEKVLMVPVASVQAGRVLVRSGARTRKIQVALGAIDGRWAEVTSGELKAGDEVLLPRK